MVDDGAHRLVTLLREAAEKVREQGDEHWASWLEHDRSLIERGDSEGLRHFLSAFGGMGSINDRSPDDPVEAVLAEAQQLASRLQREIDAP